MRSREDNAIFTNIPIENIEFYKQTNEQLQQENEELKDNWNKLKEWIGNKDNNGFEKLYLEDIQTKMQELESGDSNE